MDDLNDIDKSFESDCIAMVQEIEAYASEQQKVWEEVAEIIIDGEDVALQIELISDMKAHKLFKVKEKAATLARAIADSAKVAKTSSVRVKEIDKLKERVNSTLELASGISKQRSSLDGIGAALEKNDYETAADFVESYYEVEAQLYEVARLEEDHESDADDAVSHDTASSNSSIVDVKPCGTKTTARLLEKKREAVRAAIRSEFNNAASNRDRDQVMRFSKLFKKVGLEEEGRSQYSRWIQQGARAQLKKHVSDSLAQIGSKTSKISHLQLISTVLDHIIQCIESEEEHVLENYGPPGLHTMIKTLHQECSEHGVEVLKSFFDRYREDENGFIGTGMDSIQMDKTINEISQLCHCTILYFGYLKERCDFKEGDPEYLMPLTDFCKSSHLGRPDLYEKLQHLLNCYSPLQTNYLIAAYNYSLEQNLVSGKKQQPDQKTPSGRTSGAQSPIPHEWMNININPVSNILANFTNEDDAGVDLDAGITITEDVFYTLLNAVQRAVHTNDERIVREVVSRMNHEILQKRLLQTISENISFKKDNYVTQRTLSWMNACWTTISYTNKLSTEMIGLIKGNPNLCEPPSGESSEIVVDVKFTVMADEVNNTAQQFQELLDSAIQKTTLIITKQMIEKGTKQFEALSYVLGEAKLMNYEINDPWVISALSSWDEILAVYKAVLSADNFDTLLLEIVSYVVFCLLLF
eukprot:TRINITY_DN1116_c1_g1_i3.p1 TRINITY_DN1116_c1_g1~~TRINITY_DN1116_c1_g1_i3.p1  ORF type:complete len:697 (+),score=139.10 TRINITY_DN1116_c1_g1_i3:41-2131(+)